MFITKEIKEQFIVKGVSEADNIINIVKENNYISDYLSENKSYVYIENKEKYSKKNFETLVKALVAKKRCCTIDAVSFIGDKLKMHDIISIFLNTYIFEKHILWNQKTTEKNKKAEIQLYVENMEQYQDLINEVVVKAEQTNFARDLQIMPPNICNSEFLADYIKEKALEINDENFSFKILKKKEIEELKMGLLLSVNKGSVYEPRVVVLEYKGNPQSSEKTVIVGKGITFDSGGYSLKPASYILGMKYDMSGSAIAASALLGAAKLKAKKNISAIMMITDNRINGDASLPDSVWKSMNGKTVEVNNTDAEGRLVLADGLTYAIRNLNATRVIDIATLTGAIKVALGRTFTGLWATESRFLFEFKTAARKADELVWQMPYHEDFAEFIKSSKVADLKNTDLSATGGSSISAFMFLKEFSENLPHIHLDIAGTAKSAEEPVGVMVKTLINYALEK
ncbi:M17 family metallopeptidase [Mycoplasma phocimorsus]|uniref:M17 family metallopeptidase n=1 Tax=Mycoplasma phocimorsus TaxID=3045839 RepID=UPI0024C031B0|nr:M17 family metallopeptidase [Mycoplasma phocimorsus]MDJ1646903.1 M17 family metallopeptidase [Mycoplasma phocimorsus]